MRLPLHTLLPAMSQNQEETAVISDTSLQLQPSCLVDKVSANLLNKGAATAHDSQVTCKPTDMQKYIQLLQIVLRKGRIACQMFYSSLEMCGPSLCKRVICCQTHHLLEDKPLQAARGFPPPPPTTLIINISNSTLIDCVIGNGNYESVAVENQPLMQDSEPQFNESMKCNCSCGHKMAPQPPLPPPPPPADPQGINVHSSQLNYVIIGDNNSMQVNQTHGIQEGSGTELEEEQVVVHTAETN